MSRKSIRAPLIAAAAVGAVLVGGGALWQSGFASGSRTAQAPPTNSDAVQAHANEVHEQFDGNSYQEEASSALHAWSLNGEMDVCMETEGFPEWDWSATRQRSVRVDALATSVFFARPMGQSTSKSLIGTREAAESELSLMAEELSPEEDAAVDRCLESTDLTPNDDYSVRSIPADVRKLRQEWWDMLDGWDARYGDVASYLECFADERVERRLSTDITGDTWGIYLSTHAPGTDQIPKSATDRRASATPWHGFLSMESEFEAIDWLCRGDAYVEHLNAIDQAITGFEREHESRIEDARKAWLRVEDRAEALGFHGQAGSLD